MIFSNAGIGKMSRQALLEHHQIAGTQREELEKAFRRFETLSVVIPEQGENRCQIPLSKDPQLPV